MRPRAALVLLIGLVLLAAPVLAGGADCQKKAANTASTGKPCEMSAAECQRWLAEAKTRPWLGVDLERDGTTGAWTVVRVVPESPADRAGFQVGDQLVALNGVAFGDANKEKLAAVNEGLKLGDSVTYRVRRDGLEREIGATLTKMPEDVYLAMVEEHSKAHTDVAAR